jgi:hypothetical protein
MSAKLDTGMYQDRFAFEADFGLMVNNAKQYNVPGSYAHNEAISIETLFEKRELTARHRVVIRTDHLTQIGHELIRHWKQLTRPHNWPVLLRKMPPLHQPKPCRRLQPP